MSNGPQKIDKTVVITRQIVEQADKLEMLRGKRRELEAQLTSIHAEIGALEAALGGAVKSSW